MAKVAVIYHSGWGHTAAMARSVQKGVHSVAGCTVELLTTDQAAQKLDELDRCDALIFGCPTYMGSASAEFKKFMEASAKKWLALAWKDKLAAGFTNSGSYSGDKLSTLSQLAVFAAQHGMIWVSLGINPPQVSSGHGAKPDGINRLGSFLGAMSQSDNAPPEQAPSPGDLATAEALGARIAHAAQRWNAQR